MEIEKLNTNVLKSIEHINEVNSGSKEILSAVERVKKISIQSNENATSISAATQEQTATMHEVADASKTLAELANEMQGEVSQFKL